MFLQEENAESLWRWFYQNQNIIVASLEERDSSNDEKIVEQLNELVLSFGKLGWEMGKGINKPWSFTLTPNGDEQLLALTKEIVALAPQLDQWEFFASKQTKPWDRTFTTYDDNLQPHEIDASAWSYVALDNGQNRINIVIEASNLSYLDDDTAFKAAEFVVQQELGEETMIAKIGIIDVADELTEEDQKFKKHISELRSDIAQG